MKHLNFGLPVFLFSVGLGAAGELQTFTLTPLAFYATSRVDLSNLQDKPAGRSGFFRAENARIVRPHGTSERLWGVDIPDWTPGSAVCRAAAARGITIGAFALPDEREARAHAG